MTVRLIDGPASGPGLAHPPDGRAPTDRLPALDGWRAVAALMVLVTHTGYLTGFVVSGGAVGALVARMDFGVALFFLLSGFLLYRPWVRADLGGAEAPSVRTYAERRAARLLPAYLAALVVIFLALPQAGSPDARTWLANLTFTQIYVPATLVEGFTQTWSLATEVSFYVALPLLAWLARSARRRPLRGHVAMVSACAVLGVGFVVAGAFGRLPPESGFWLPSFLLWFALGMGCALVAAAREQGTLTRTTGLATRIAAESTACLVAGLLIILILATPLAGPYTLDPASSWSVVIKHVGYGAAALLLLLPAFLGSDRSWHSRILCSAALQWLGRISYAVFLWHLAAAWALLNLTGRSPFTGGFVLLTLGTALVTCLVATASWHLLEAPALRRAHRPRESPRDPAERSAGLHDGRDPVGSR